MSNVLNERNADLDVLRKYDLYCESVIDKCSRAKLYNYDKSLNYWKLQTNSEGPFYLIKRVTIPFYMIIILCKENKAGSSIFKQIPISENLITQVSNNFIMIKNEQGSITSIGFISKPDCDRIHNSFLTILNELKNNKKLTEINSFNQTQCSDPNAAVLKTKNQETDKLKSMFENARIRSGSVNQNVPLNSSTYQAYNNVESNNKTRPIDINELFAPLSSNKNPVTETFLSDQQMRPRAISSPLHNITNNLKLSQTQPEINGSYSGDTSGKMTASLTVTELERKLVEDASLTKPKLYEENASVDDDDDTLLQPDQFENRINNPINSALLENNVFQKLSAKPTYTSTQPILSKEALKDALIFLLQNDADGSFISQIHSAYVTSMNKQMYRK